MQNLKQQMGQNYQKFLKMIQKEEKMKYIDMVSYVIVKGKNKECKMKKGSQDKIKVTFGKRKKGKAQKSFNKHDRKERNYRGQGR